MVVQRSDLERLKDMPSLIAFFRILGFLKFNQITTNEFRISLSNNSLISMLVLIISDRSQITKYNSKLDGIDTVCLSLITSDFENFMFVKKEFSEAGTTRYKRFSFSKNKLTNSVLKKLNSLKFDDPTSFDNLFDTSEIVKNFYREFILHRANLIRALDEITEVQTRIKYSQVLMNRLIFLYFIQKKGLLNHDFDYLTVKLLYIQNQKKNFYTDFLKPFFFQALSIEGFTNPIFGQIPFLNGGLFREHEIEQLYPKLLIKNDIFYELFQFLNSYYWYSDERADFGEEKGLSPEVLGHIFEQTINALSESGNGQKEKGAYYTPEIITSYISKRILYSNILPIPSEKFGFTDINFIDLFKLNTGEREKVMIYIFEEILPNFTILDNACGSGAFLLAILNELIPIYSKVIYNILPSMHLKKTIQLYLDHRKLPNSWINWNFINLEEFMADNRWRYFIKRMIIIKNIYGVDIEEGATEIAKLRLWLAMVADIDDIIEDVEPLPNIEYNIRSGNSLIGFSEIKVLNSIDNYIQIDSLNNAIQVLEPIYPLLIKEIKFLSKNPTLMNLIKIKEQLITTFKVEENQQNQLKIKYVIDQSLKILNLKVNDKYLAFVNSKLPKSHQISIDHLNELKPFHWILEFPNVLAGEFNREKKGFKIILGNPPYGNISSDNEKKIYKILDWCLKEIAGTFIDRSIELIQPGGSLSFIMTYAITFSKDLSRERYRIYQTFKDTTIASFDRDKCRFFEGMTQSVSIINCDNRKSLSSKIDSLGQFSTTQMFRRMPNITSLSFINANDFLLGEKIGVKFSEQHRLPKLGQKETFNFLQHLKSVKNSEMKKVGDLIGPFTHVKTDDELKNIPISSTKFLWLRTSGNYWYNAWDHAPYFGTDIAYVEIKLPQNQSEIRSFLLLLMNSSLFYLWNRIYSDGRHLNTDILGTLPLPTDFQSVLIKYKLSLNEFAKFLMQVMFNNFDNLHNRFLSSKFKSVLDTVDILIGRIYNFSQDEIRFFQNYEDCIRKGMLLSDVLWNQIESICTNFQMSLWISIKNDLIQSVEKHTDEPYDEDVEI